MSGEATKAFRTLGIFLLISSNTPNPPAFLRRDICSSTDSRTKIFSPKLPAAVLMLAHACARAIRSYEATKFKQDTQGCQKSISSHKLSIIIVTSTIHYATENNCKEISQDRKMVRKNAHAQMSGRLPN